MARALVVYLQREGGQAQFSSRLQAQFTDHAPIRDAQNWAVVNLAADLSGPALSARAGMSERTFRRAVFAEASRAFVDRIRIEAARQMLEGKLPLQTWLETMDTLRRAFVRPSASRPSATANASIRRGFRCLPRR